MALTLIPETLFPVLPAGGDGTTRPLHQGECVRRAWPQVLGDGDRPGVVSPGALCPPAGAGAPAAPGQRTRRRGRREQGTGRRDTPARGPGRWGPPGRPAVAHVRRGHAASSPAPASRGGNGALAASPAPPERPGPASAATAPCRRPHLPAHVQQRVIVFIVQLLLAQGRRHLRNLSPRQTGRPRSGGTGGRRRAPRERPGGATAAPGGPEARRRRPRRRAARLRPAPPRGRGRERRPGPSTCCPRTQARPGRARSVRGPGKRDLAGAGGGGHPLRAAETGPCGTSLPAWPAPRARRTRLPARLCTGDLHMGFVPPPLLSLLQNLDQRVGLLFFISYDCPVCRSVGPVFCCLK